MRKEMCMEELAAVLQKDGLLVSVSGSARFSEVCYDSRQVKPGALFVCKGLAFKPEFLDAALRQGAVCYMAETDFGVKGIPCLIVRNVRQALSLASIYRYGRPFEAFSLVGITGTKGKTTTAYFTRSILDQAAGRPTALLSTVEMFTGGQPQEAHLTTPESLELQACFDDTRAHSIPFLTMEVSSQAYKQSRVHGVPFDVGVFLNIDEDHLGPLEHADYEDYLSCKLELLKNSRTVVIYSGTRDFQRVRDTAVRAGAKVITFGRQGDDYTIGNLEKLPWGFAFDILANGFQERVSIDMEGRFNIMNALAATAAARALGADAKSISAGLRHVKVPGRMNLFQKNGAMILVDYAHNFLSFTELFDSLERDYPGRPIKVVCGCPGGKNLLRRRDIGRLCGKHASYVYLTEEDPGFEDPEEICRQMAAFIDEDRRAGWEIITDRVAAVEKAVSELGDGDILIVAGKGEEVYRKFRGEYLPCESDIQVVRRCLGESFTAPAD